MNFEWPAAGRAHGRAAYFNGGSYYDNKLLDFDHAWGVYVKNEYDTKGLDVSGEVKVESSLYRAAIQTFDAYWGYGFREWQNVGRLRQYPGRKWEASELDITRSAMTRRTPFSYRGAYDEFYVIYFVQMTLTQPNAENIYTFMANPIPYVNAQQVDVWYFQPPGRFSSGPYVTLSEAESEMRFYASETWGLK